jgi:hypothetical protein
VVFSELNSVGESENWTHVAEKAGRGTIADGRRTQSISEDWKREKGRQISHV